MSEPNQQQQSQNQEGTSDGDNEKGFWDKLGKFMDERIDAGVERALQKHGRVGASRNPERTSVPGFFAQLMGGPFSPTKEK